MENRIYRCGWCGSFTRATGENLTGKQFKKAARIISQYGDVRTTLINGECCKHEAMN
jgi:hypothetical protein